MNKHMMYNDPIFLLQVLIDNIKNFAPIIYTPTVGLVCQNYSGLFRRPRGMYFSAKDKGEMMSIVYNWPAPEVWLDSQSSLYGSCDPFFNIRTSGIYCLSKKIVFISIYTRGSFDLRTYELVDTGYA